MSSETSDSEEETRVVYVVNETVPHLWAEIFPLDRAVRIHAVAFDNRRQQLLQIEERPNEPPVLRRYASRHFLALPSRERELGCGAASARLVLDEQNGTVFLGVNKFLQRLSAADLGIEVEIQLTQDIICLLVRDGEYLLMTACDVHMENDQQFQHTHLNVFLVSTVTLCVEASLSLTVEMLNVLEESIAVRATPHLAGVVGNDLLIVTPGCAVATISMDLLSRNPNEDTSLNAVDFRWRQPNNGDGPGLAFASPFTWLESHGLHDFSSKDYFLTHVADMNMWLLLPKRQHLGESNAERSSLRMSTLGRWELPWRDRDNNLTFTPYREDSTLAYFMPSRGQVVLHFPEAARRVVLRLWHVPWSRNHHAGASEEFRTVVRTLCELHLNASARGEPTAGEGSQDDAPVIEPRGVRRLALAKLQELPYEVLEYLIATLWDVYQHAFDLVEHGQEDRWSVYEQEDAPDAVQEAEPMA